MYVPAKLLTLRELLLYELFLLLIPMAAYPIREIFRIGKDRRKGQRSTALVCSAIGYPQIQRPCFLGSRDRIDSIQNRQQQEKILQKSADKHLFQCYRVKHSRKSCRQRTNPKRTIKRNEGALRPRMAAALLLVLFRKIWGWDHNPRQLNNQQRGSHRSLFRRKTGCRGWG